MERGEALKLSNHGCAIYNGEQLLATTFIDETGERMPTDKEIALAAALCNAVAALDRIALNLQNKAMTSEQERAFSYSPAAESWRIYLSGLILEARNDAKFALQHIKNNLPVVS